LDDGEAVARDVGLDLAPQDGLVHGRQRLGTEQGRREKLVLARDLDACVHQVQDDSGVDDEPGHRVPDSVEVVAQDL
jgi:hypothetical protein